jgi:prolycopene isomerase
VAEVVATGIRELGGVIETNARVDKVIVENSVAKGVVAGGKTYLADNIISNADIKHTMLELVGEKKLDEQYLNQIKPLEYSYSALVLRLALDKVLADWKLITHIASDDPVGHYKALEEGKVPDSMNAFLPVPSNFAPDVAPEGKQLVTVATAVPYEFPRIESLKQMLLDLVQHFLPEINKHIMWTDVTTPSDINNFVGENGAVIGIAQTVRQSGSNRPGVTTPINNLYLCGAEAGGWGVGVELAVESAKNLSLLIP